MTKPPESPYPPDLADEDQAEPDFDNLVDVVATDMCDLSSRSAQSPATRATFLANAALFASVLGIEILAE